MVGQQGIPQYEPWLGEEELALVTETIRDNWITSGEKTRLFEEAIARECQVKHALAVSNGTLALYIALKMLDIGLGDEVIVPDFTFIASANAVVMAGAKPVLVDVDPDTFNIDIEQAENSITRKTKAVMPVHIFGQSADMDAVLEFSRRRGLYVVEDAAQGLGVTFEGQPVGGIGDVGTLSFYADKTITTGEGGMILTNNDDLAKRCVILKNQGRTQRGEYFHEFIGYNFRLTDLQAAVGLAQFGKLPEIIRRKKAIEAAYAAGLADVPGITLPYRDPRSHTVPFRANILIQNPKGLSAFLQEHKVGSREFFYPIHRQPPYLEDRSFPNSDYAHQHGVSLPSAVTLTTQQIDYICDLIRDYLQDH